MEFKKVNVDDMKLNKDTQVSKTYTREVVKGSRLEQFVGNPPEKEPLDCTFFAPLEEQMKTLDDYAKAVQEIFKMPSNTEE